MWHIVDNIYLGNSTDGKAQATYKQVNGLWFKNDAAEYLTLNVAKDLFVQADVHIGLVDGAGNHGWQYRMAVRVLAELHRNTSAHVMVYCHEGRSRSVSIIAAYLAIEDGFSGVSEFRGFSDRIEDAFKYIANKRPDISPSAELVSEMMAAMSAYENKKT